MGDRDPSNVICTQDTYSLTGNGRAVRTTHSGLGKFNSSVQLPNKRRAKDLPSAFDQAWLRSEKWPRRKKGAGTIRIADLFSGCGAMTLGVVEAARALNLTALPQLAVDYDTCSADTYAANFPSANVICDGIENLLDHHVGQRPSASEKSLIKSVGELDVIIGGPPCQGHSDLNNHTRRADPRNGLLWKMARAAELWRPDSIIIENVQGIRHDSEDVVGRMSTFLNGLGYSIDQKLVEMVGLGVPQRRRRFVLLASLCRDVDISTITQSFHCEPRTVRWAVGDIERTNCSVFHSPSSATGLNRRRMDYLFDNDLFDLPDHQRPECHRSKPHSYKSVYGRLRWDAPSQTITTGFGSMGQGRYVHPARRRTITPHEAARLQFIPDFFVFETESRSALARMIANAVPPKLSYVLSMGLLG